MTVPTDDGPLRLVGLEGLLRLKIRAQGPQDLLDVAVLVLRHPEYRERAREIAAAVRPDAGPRAKRAGSGRSAGSRR